MKLYEDSVPQVFQFGLQAALVRRRAGKPAACGNRIRRSASVSTPKVWASGRVGVGTSVTPLNRP